MDDSSAIVRTAVAVEWPTVAVLGAIGFGGAVVFATHDRLPAVVVLAVLGVLSAWYGSVRHEVVHGHPTPWAAVNTALVAVPFGLTQPFWQYRDEHVRHHVTDALTEPTADPESQYVTADAWRSMSPVTRLLRRANMTFAGRMLLGPWFATAAVVRGLAVDWRRGRRLAVARFVVADVMVLVGVHLAGLGVGWYVLGVAYVGTSLTLVRSFAEHRAVAVGSPTAVVQGGRFWSLLFLNNNLHVTHHDRPGLAWYRLPAAHDATADDTAAAGAGCYRRYGEVASRFLLRPVAPPVHPGTTLDHA